MTQQGNNCIDKVWCRLLAARAEWMGPGCTPLPVFGPWPLEKVLRHTAALQSMPHTFFNQTNLVAKPQQQVTTWSEVQTGSYIS